MDNSTDHRPRGDHGSSGDHAHIRSEAMSAVRSRRIEVTFRHPFRLPGFLNAEPAGVYAVEIDEEQIGGMNTIGFLRTATWFNVPALGVKSSVSRAYPITQEELDSAWEADQTAGGKEQPEK